MPFTGWKNSKIQFDWRGSALYNLVMDQADKKTGDHGKTLAKWSFPEFIKHERSRAWYFWIIAAIALLLIYAVATVNFLFAVIIVIAAITYVLIYRREPEYVNFAITEDGLADNERFFSFDEVKNFFIIYKPPEIKTLFVDFKALTKPRLAVPLENQNPLAIRKLLLEYLTEDLDKDDEPFLDGLRRMFKL